MIYRRINVVNNGEYLKSEFIRAIAVLITKLLRIALFIPPLICFMVVSFANEVKASNCALLLPNEANKEIGKRFKNWHILEQRDLVSDDQVLWEENRPNECPGVAIGTFSNLNTTEYAVLIISKLKKGAVKLLLLRRNEKGKYDIKLLHSETNTGNFPVIHKDPPGRYYYFYDRKKSINAKTDVLIYEHIEASSILFYYEKGIYKKLLISD